MGPSAASSFYADLHIHSKYSRACSRDCDLEHLSWWARRKGITLVGTGDFTHPAWFDHLTENLVPAEPGLFRLRDEREILRTLPGALAAAPVRFMLSVEISTIYKRDDRTRKVHHLVYFPDFAAVTRFNTALGRIGNLGSDGRPILGLDSRDLLEIVLDASPEGYLIPAHVWTPWFSVLGSKSGFDAVADCYADLADHIFALETGLSSDPPMNWRVSSLDKYRLVSNSDAHSPPALGREATWYDCPLDYWAVRRALETGDGLGGTVEFFPEEGKYHADGHRKCDVRLSPAETLAVDGRCPACGKPLTVGVLHRVEALADRDSSAAPPASAADFRSLVQLPEIVGEIHRVGPRTKTVTRRIDTLVGELGPELEILTTVPTDEVTRVGGELLGEAITRLRRGEVIRDAGYDGEYGTIRLFTPDELHRTAALFDVPTQRAAADPAPPAALPPAVSSLGVHDQQDVEPVLSGMEEVGTGLLDRLDAMQRVAASAPGGPLLVVAGPGTGKTRTLTHRIAYLVADLGIRPEQCLAITFTRRAAEEMATRLAGLIPDVAAKVTVTTLHKLGLTILRDPLLRDALSTIGLTPAFRVADDAERAAAAAAAAAATSAASADLRARDLVDLDELITLPGQLLTGHPAVVEELRARWQWVFVDEYQDVDADQYALLRLLCPPDGNLCAIGDPDQAIYGFRGADVRFFLSFTEDFVDARQVRLARNYRSAAPILAGAVQAIAPSTLVPGRILEPTRREGPLIGVHAAATAGEEADLVARTIEELVGGGSHHSLDSGRVDSRAVAPTAMSFADIAVLYRTDAQAAPIVEALSRAGIPVQKRSHDRLLSRPGVAALAREMTLAVGGSRAASSDVAERVRRSARTLAARGPALFSPDGPEASEVDLFNAVDLLMPLATRCGDDLEAFLVALTTGAEVDAWDPRADRVTLLTLHAAKGLEFPVVFLVGCEKGLLPLRLPGAPTPIGDDLAEERRLFFVGMTRARDRLYLSHVARRGTRDTGASPFLSVIDPSLLERRGGVVRPRPKAQQLRLL